MNTFLVNLIWVVASFIFMEGVAWFTHKYIMHGLLWNLHHDHHNKNHTSHFEKNDFFFLFFAIPGILGLFYGMAGGFNAFFWIGLGITLYGFTYFLVHDVFIHQRFKWLRNSDSIYFRALRKAHKVHHKQLRKEGAECFGMLLVPYRFFKEASRRGK
ncbi:MAG: sterol desaturase family protein [Flavobacteriales bacterium]|nr:sterol desaturase family protein [Flavobacteriales bacterium]